MPSLDSLIDIPPLATQKEKLKDSEYFFAAHCQQIDISTVCHVDELVTQRSQNPLLHDKNYTTGDFFIYFVENNLPKLAITRITHNPLFQTDCIKKISEDFQFKSVWHGLKIKEDALQKALIDPQTTIIDLYTIRQTYSEGMYDYLCINPQNKTSYFRNFRSYEPERRNPTSHIETSPGSPYKHETPHYQQQGTHIDYDHCPFSKEDTKLLYRLFGPEELFNQNIDPLVKADISYLKIMFMSIKNVMKYCSENALGHFVTLRSFKNYSDINGKTGSYELLLNNHIRGQPNLIQPSCPPHAQSHP